MTWFFAVLIVLLMGAVAVVAAGFGGSMAEVYDDRPDSRVQAEGPLLGEDLRKVRFTTAFRGYRMSEVDSLLARLAGELDAAGRETPEPPAPPVQESPGTSAARESSNTHQAAPPQEAGQSQSSDETRQARERES
ncbi:MAG TPA: DivIVA domain-containing protein [Nocardioidaceae bacterium]|nr:DivIVA domain-containing protein [Nocardioidaceae bacterium]